MRALIQRVSEASVKVDGKIEGEISKGILLLLGVAEEDETTDSDWLINKISNLRIFPDLEGVMNLSVKDIDGEVLVISQFTLLAKTKKGNRPSYIAAANPQMAKEMYEDFINRMESVIGKKVPSGIFAADMKVALINDGPVTIWLDTKNKE